jgi:hypothetical protein
MMMAARNENKKETKREEERRKKKAKKERRRRAIATDRPVPTLHSYNISLWGKSPSSKRNAHSTPTERALFISTAMLLLDVGARV